jgi:hypothetical protein
MMNTDKCREAVGIDYRIDDDGFWRFGYGNDRKRRRLIRRAEKINLKQQDHFDLPAPADCDKL